VTATSRSIEAGWKCQIKITSRDQSLLLLGQVLSLGRFCSNLYVEDSATTSFARHNFSTPKHDFPAATDSASNTMETPLFRHGPLKADQIRLLHVFRTSDELSKSLACYLETVSLGDNLEYIALSYTWDESSQANSHKILLDSKTFLVGENLHWALHQLATSMTDNSVTIWIDAVCLYLDWPQTKHFRKSRC
jgi:hypothetical protein